jgi:transposase
MAAMSRRAVITRRLKAYRMLDQGAGVPQVAQELGVTARTVAEWQRRRRKRKPRQAGSPAGAPRRRSRMAASPAQATVAEMIRREGPAVARVLLDMAKGGDVRAASLVFKLLGEGAGGAEEGDGEADQRGLERELRSLPPAIASEIVGLLEKAEAESEKRGKRKGAPVGGEGRSAGRLPWGAESEPSDQGADPV